LFTVAARTGRSGVVEPEDFLLPRQTEEVEHLPRFALDVLDYRLVADFEEMRGRQASCANAP
jgi:hypothetical protein